jgi:hypothetical protein
MRGSAAPARACATSDPMRCDLTMADQSYYDVSAPVRVKRRKTGGRKAGTPNRSTAPRSLREANSRKKVCSQCGQAKHVAQFYRDPLQSSGLTPQCKTCRRARSRVEYAADDNLRRANAYKARVRSYGLSASEFDRMLVEQAGLCRVCDDPLGPNPNQLHVDHCHVTGRIRALLCRRCNVALGAAGESPDRLRGLAVYLEDQQQFLADLAAFMAARAPGPDPVR